MYKVLIVEDDPMVAMLNKQYVNRDPHFQTSHVCRDGKSALEYLRANAVDLVILDVYMPRNDGLSLLKKLREEQLPVSVIMVTAANDRDTVEEALRFGVVDYLVKPFLGERFQKALETFLERQEVFRDTASFNQNAIDSLIGASRSSSAEPLPKGIQPQTLERIREFLEEEKFTEFSSEEVADRIGLSRVTVRRYMNYLMEKGFISGQMNYGTGGRPSMLYRRNKL